MSNQIDQDRLLKSIIALAIEINYLHSNENQFIGEARNRGEFLFIDSGIPKPRASTALAWASLCAFGPINGFKGWQNGSRIYRHFDVTKGRFLLPFLPKLNLHDEQNQSLARISRFHEKDTAKRFIKWGHVHIGDAESGQILDQLLTGQFIAKEWMDSRPFGKWLVDEASWAPILFPLWAEPGEGWQFGVIQYHLPSLAIDLRHPFNQLAINGIPLTHRMQNIPTIRRLLFRFLDPVAIMNWAQAYAEAMQFALDDEAIEKDVNQLQSQILAKKYAADKAQSQHDASSRKKKRKSHLPDFFHMIPEQVRMESNESKPGTESEQTG